MTLMRIRLELGRTSDAPRGDSSHGYELIMPLDAQGHVEIAGWDEQKGQCGVRSFRAGHPDRHGMLKRSGRGWCVDYDPRHTKDDEPFFRLDRHVISPDLYVTIREEDGKQRPFRIVAVSPLENAA